MAKWQKCLFPPFPSTYNKSAFSWVLCLFYPNACYSFLSQKCHLIQLFLALFAFLLPSLKKLKHTIKVPFFIYKLNGYLTINVSLSIILSIIVGICCAIACFNLYLNILHGSKTHISRSPLHLESHSVKVHSCLFLGFWLGQRGELSTEF